MSPAENPRPPFPPYHAETAAQKARMASINDLPIHESQPKNLSAAGSPPRRSPDSFRTRALKAIAHPAFQETRRRRRAAGRSREVPSAAAGGDMREARKSSS